MKNTFAHIIQTPTVKYKHAKGMRDVFGKEFHQFHEIFLFISGNASFTTEEQTVKLKPYTIIVIPENTFHSFHVIGDEADYERYVFNFNHSKEIDQLARTMQSIIIIESPPDNIISDFLTPDNTKYSDTEKRILISSKLLSILIELGHLIPKKEKTSTNLNDITVQCLNYINSNIYSPLTVAHISKNLNYSRSCISHTFKKDLNVPLYKYITEKKLIFAHKDIKSGIPATTVSKKYAFADYSCFFRHYKKYFGFPPSSKNLSEISFF